MTSAKADAPPIRCQAVKTDGLSRCTFNAACRVIDCRGRQFNYCARHSKIGLELHELRNSEPLEAAAR